MSCVLCRIFRSVLLVRPKNLSSRLLEIVSTLIFNCSCTLAILVLSYMLSSHDVLIIISRFRGCLLSAILIILYILETQVYSAICHLGDLETQQLRLVCIYVACEEGAPSASKPLQYSRDRLSKVLPPDRCPCALYFSWPCLEKPELSD